MTDELEAIQQSTIKRNQRLIKAEAYYEENHEKMPEETRNKLALTLMKAATIMGSAVWTKIELLENIKAFDAEMEKGREIIRE